MRISCTTVLLNTMQWIGKLLTESNINQCFGKASQFSSKPLSTSQTMRFKVLVVVVIIGLVLVDAQDRPQCPHCSDGKPTSCTCPDGSEVAPKRKMCGASVFPTSCTCLDGGVLNIPDGGCKIGRPKCPKCSSGRPTSCTCPDGSTIDKPKKGACGERMFPTSCTCEDGEVLHIPEGGCKRGGRGSIPLPGWTTPSPPAPPSGETRMVRRSLSAHSKAKCNDGTAATYYVQEAPESSDRVLVYFQGGGKCSNKQDCQRRCGNNKKNRLCTASKASSMDYPDLLDEGLFWSIDPEENPPFYSHFKVRVPYCSSDAWTGTKWKSKANGNFIFYGKHIVRAVIEDLLEDNPWISEVKQFVVLGTSAGSFGVSVNCDMMAERLHEVNPSMDIRCIMDGGEFRPYWIPNKCNITDDAKTFWNAEPDKSCAESGSSHCGSFSASFEHVTTPFMITHSQWDKITDRDECSPPTSDTKFWEKWRAGKVELAERVIESRPDSGIYLNACSYHVSTKNNKIWGLSEVPVVDGQGEEVLMNLIRNWLNDVKPNKAYDDPQQDPQTNPNC